MKQCLITLFLFLLVSCTVDAPTLGPITTTGPAVLRDLDTSTEKVSNCKGGKVSRHPEMNISLSEGVEWEVNGEVGAAECVNGLRQH